MAKLQPLLSREELDALLHSEQVWECGWIEDENRRKLCYRELISSADRQALLRMVRSIHLHKAKQGHAGKKLHLCDENFLRDAEKLLYGEFAVVLGMEISDTKSYILNALECNEY